MKEVKMLKHYSYISIVFIFIFVASTEDIILLIT